MGIGPSEGSVLFLFFILIQIGIVVFLLSLAIRLVKAVENIAGELSVMNETRKET